MRKQLCVLGVLLCLSSVGVVRAEDPKPLGTSISWTTSDGIKLVGVYHPARPGRLVWVLLHGLGSNKEEWLRFARPLVAQGDGFLIYDARGHGESVHHTSGGTLMYRDFKTAGPGSQWDRMSGDLGSAVNALKTRYALDPQSIAVGGASLGANVAVVYASQHPEVPALVALSPGLDYAGVSTESAFERYGTRPAFLAASPGDTYAYASVRQLILHRRDPACRVASGEGAAHGVNLLNEAFTKKLLDWIKGLN